MLRLLSPSPPRDDQPSPDFSSPEFFDLDLDLPDFDPVKEWLVDPEDTVATEQIDEKMEKVRIDDDGVGALKGDAVSEAHTVSDSIKVAPASDEDETDESDKSDTDDWGDVDRSSSSSSESSSSSSEEENDGGNDERIRVAEVDEMLDLEEGEIREPDEEELFLSSDEDEEVGKRPIKSKHEIQDLPPVPQVEVVLEPHHRTLPVGVISSIMPTRVIVEGSENHKPLSEGSVLWITETRSPLGLIDEIFGPVKSPYYIVRYNFDKEVPAGIRTGTSVSFVLEFANHILKDDINKKGYDASGENDEEVNEELEFSDDEKEAEYRRSLRQSKRGAENPSHGKQEANNRANLMRPRNDRWHRNQQPATNTRTNFKGRPSNDSWRGNQERLLDKRTNFEGGPVQKCMRPPVPHSLTAMEQPPPSARGLLQPPMVPAHFGTNPSIPEATLHPMQSGIGFNYPTQQLLLQQLSALMAFLTPQQMQMISQGAYPTNVLPNQVFNSFPNMVPGLQQFVPNIANMPWLGQTNIGQAPFGCSTGQNYGQPPMQFNPFSFPTVHGAEGHGASGSCNPQSYPYTQPSINQGGMFPMQFDPSICHGGAVGQSSVGQAPFGCSTVNEQGVSGSSNAESSRQHQSTASEAPFSNNMLDQGASGSFNSQSYPNLRPSIIQGGIFPTQVNPSIGPVGVAGQSVVSQSPESSTHQSTASQASFGNNMQEQGASESFNTQSHLQLQPSVEQGGMHPPMQFNSFSGPTTLPGPVPLSSSGPTPFGYLNPRPSIYQGGNFPMQFNPSIGHGGPALFGCGNVHEHGASGSSNAESSKQQQSTASQAPFSNSMPEQGASGSLNAHSHLQSRPSGELSGMHHPMLEQGASGLCNSQSFLQPPACLDQSRMHPPIQFNSGRSSRGGRNPNQRGGRGRFFGRGGRPQNR